MTRPDAASEAPATLPSGLEVGEVLVGLRTRPMERELTASARRLLIEAARSAMDPDHPDVVSTLAAHRVLARSGHDHGTAQVPGDPHRYDPRDAAFLLAAGASPRWTREPNPAPVLAAAIVAAGQLDAAPDALLRATVVGLEVLDRLADASDPDRGWDLTGTAGVVASAIVVGELRLLDARQIAHAIGVAGSSTVGLSRHAGPRSRAAHAGKAAANGLLAATLAAEGFTAPLDALGAARGYFGVLFPETPPDQRAAEVIGHLGVAWSVHVDTALPTDPGLPADAIGVPRALIELPAPEESSLR